MGSHKRENSILFSLRELKDTHRDRDTAIDKPQSTGTGGAAVRGCDTTQGLLAGVISEARAAASHEETAIQEARLSRQEEARRRTAAEEHRRREEALRRRQEERQRLERQDARRKARMREVFPTRDEPLRRPVYHSTAQVSIPIRPRWSVHISVAVAFMFILGSAGTFYTLFKPRPIEWADRVSSLELPAYPEAEVIPERGIAKELAEKRRTVERLQNEAREYAARVASQRKPKTTRPVTKPDRPEQPKPFVIDTNIYDPDIR